MKKQIIKATLKTRELTTAEHSHVAGGYDFSLVALGGVRGGGGPRPGGTDAISGNFATQSFSLSVNRLF